MNETYNLQEIKSIAQKIVSTFPAQKIFCLEAEMGSGKTTLIKNICLALDCDVQHLSSPTFSIVNEYKSTKGLKILHIDLYRLKDIEELFALGWEDYIDTCDKIFIEWSEILIPYLYQEYVFIELNKIDESTRQISALLRK